MLTVDWIVVAAMALSIIILVGTNIDATRGKKYYPDNVDPMALRQRNCYLHSSIIFAFMHYWCILFSILSTLIVLYIGCYEETNLFSIKNRIILYSSLSLFTTICPYVVNLIKISRKYRLAFNIIEGALLGNGDYADALKKGEQLITDGFED